MDCIPKPQHHGWQGPPHRARHPGNGTIGIGYIHPQLIIHISSITTSSITTLLDSQREQPSSTVSVHPAREKPGGVGRVSGGEESHFRQNGHLPSIDCSRPLQLRSMNLASRILVKTTPAALLSHTFSPLHCASHTSTDQR